jgi:hypothetical protein
MAVTMSKQRQDEPVAAGRPAARSQAPHVCAECRHARVFAVQPWAMCTCEGSPSAGKTLFAGAPACTDMSPRDDAQWVLSIYGLQRMPARLASATARIH